MPRWSGCGACGGRCFLVAYLSAVVKDVLNDEIPHSPITPTRVAVGGSPGPDGAAPHPSTPVELKQLSHAFSEKYLCAVFLSCVHQETKRPVSVPPAHDSGGHTARNAETVQTATAVEGAALLSVARAVVEVPLWRR